MTKKAQEGGMAVFILVILGFVGMMVFVSMFNPRNPGSLIYNQNITECMNITEIKCFRYYSKGGIFGGVQSERVSCKSNYDWEKHYYDGEDCYSHTEYIYEKEECLKWM